MIRDFVLSVIRTYVPLLVGGGLTWVGNALGVEITQEMTAGTAGMLVLVISGLYYLVARGLESRWPWLSILLATPPKTAAPHYENSKTIRGTVTDRR